jgi:hypothetical protein
MLAKFVTSKVIAVSLTACAFVGGWGYIARDDWRASGPHLSVEEARAIEEWETAVAWQRLAAVIPPEPVYVQGEPAITYRTVYVPRIVHQGGASASDPAPSGVPIGGSTVRTQVTTTVQGEPSSTKPRTATSAPATPPSSSAPPPSNDPAPSTPKAKSTPTTKTKGS